MKIAFLQNLYSDLLGVMSISAVLKKHGHTAKVFIEDAENNLEKSLVKFNPDVVGFPVFTGSHLWALKWAAKIKAKYGKIILFGGPHATFYPEVIENPAVDIVCRGEGEYPTLDLLNALRDKKPINKIKNLWIKENNRIYKNDVRPLISDLDTLPFFDRQIYYRYPALAKNQIKNFFAIRGCPFNCTFCHNFALKKLYQGKGIYVRFRSPENVIREILEVRKNYPLRTVDFADDTFTLNHLWLKFFLKLYRKKVNLPFICGFRVDTVNEEIIQELANSGCKVVFIGVESGNEKIRNQLLKKNIYDKDIIKTARLLHKYKIKFITNNMMGLPGETLEDAIKTVKLNAKIKTDYPWCSIYQPYPGTWLGDYSARQGYLEEIRPDEFSPSFFKDSLLNTKDIEAIVNLQKLFYIGVKYPRTIPYFKKMVRLRLRPLYHLIFLITFGYRFMKANQYNLFEMIGFSLRVVKFYRKND
jgi:radical SAM superfamily enzyme YgiQ (UPF0313 family)